MKKSMWSVKIILGCLALCIILLCGTACSFWKDSSDSDNAEINLYPAFVVGNGVCKWGLINDEGKFVVKPTYDHIEWEAGKRFARIYARIAEPAEANKEGAENTDPRVADEAPMSVGLIDRSNGKVILQPKYLFVTDFSEGLATVQVAEDKYMVIDEKGKTVFESKDMVGLFSDGLVWFKTLKDGEPLYGYMDKKGKVKIEPIYKETGSFTDGQALVTIEEGIHAVINDKGKNVSNLSFARVGGMSEGMIKFLDNESGKWGYADADGKIVIQSQFDFVDSFQDGFAIVGLNNKFGLINKKGEFVIPAEYQRIIALGKGYYSAYKGSVPNPKYFPKAVFNQEGQQLTGALYYDVGNYQNGYFSVCDGKATYFIEKNGQQARKLPKFNELGRLEFDGDLIKAQFDRQLKYYTKDGKLVWESKVAYKMGNIYFEERKYMPSWTTVSYYPQMVDYQDVVLQSKINKLIENAVLENNRVHEPDAEGAFPADIREDHYSLNRYQDLLVIKYEAYYYPVGAAHGEPRVRMHHINLQDGTVYQLKDLFIPGANYRERFAAEINRQIAGSTKTEEGEPEMKFAGFKQEPSFQITRDKLIIYLLASEITEYSYPGIISFDISYDKISDIIDTKGALWQSFHKKVSGVEQLTPPADSTQGSDDIPEAEPVY